MPEFLPADLWNRVYGAKSPPRFGPPDSGGGSPPPSGDDNLGFFLGELGAS